MQSDFSGFRAQNGYVLLSVVFTLLILAILSYQLSRESAFSTGTVIRQQQMQIAQYVAEAGLQHAIWQLNQAKCSGYSELTNTNFGNHQYSVSINDESENSVTSGSPVTLISTARLNNDLRKTIIRKNVKIYSSSTLQPGNEGKDSFILNQSPTDNKGDNADLVTNSKQQANRTVHSLLQFLFSDEMSEKSIISAIFSLYLYNNGGKNDTVEAHRVTQSWTEGTGFTSNGVNWSTSDGIQSWTNAGGDYESDIEGSFVANTTGWKDMDIPNLVTTWQTGSQPNYGLILLSPP